MNTHPPFVMFSKQRKTMYKISLAWVGLFFIVATISIIMVVVLLITGTSMSVDEGGSLVGSIVGLIIFWIMTLSGVIECIKNIKNIGTEKEKSHLLNGICYLILFVIPGVLILIAQSTYNNELMLWYNSSKSWQQPTSNDLNEK